MTFSSALQIIDIAIKVMEIYKEHSHTPPHLFLPESVYFVTGATANRRPYLKRNSLKGNLVQVLLEEATRNLWELRAWVVLENHYHFIAKAPEDSKSLTQLIRGLHSRSGRHINEFNGVKGRRIWYNYWDSCVTNETSYLARLRYIFLNPVLHGLVENPEEYAYSSYDQFMKFSEPEFRERVLSQPIDRINVHDDF